jgi:hypothetical protein
VRSLVLFLSFVAAVAWGAMHLQSGDAAAAEPTHEAQAGEIASISIGGHAVPVNELRQVLASKPGERLDDARLAADREAMQRTLVSHGYLAARVYAPDVTRGANGAAFVTFTVAMGPLYHVRTVSVTGATARDIGVVTIAKGDPAESERIAHARQVLADRLVARGKHVEVAAELRTDDAASAVDVVLAAK